jgi:hypothetical protein
MFDRGGYHASFFQRGGDQFLRLTAETIQAPSDYGMNYGDASLRTGYTNLGYEIEYEHAGDYPYWINTRQPVGNETVFLPKDNVTIQKPAVPTYTIGSGIRFNPVLEQYQMDIYADYNTSTGTTIHIFADIDGLNNWREEFDAWRGNSYSDYFQISFSGPVHGWDLARGELKSGEGKYLDGTY